MKTAMRPFLRNIVALIVIGMLLGCARSQDPEAMYRDYVDRLVNVTGFEPRSVTEMEPIPPYPRPRDSVLPEEEVRVGFLTLLSLGECQLLQAVSERNSSLGRVQAASGRLLYEANFLARIRACESQLLASQDQDREFIDQVVTIRQIKEANLPRTFWNATFGGPEFRTLLSTGTPPLQRSESLALAETELALDQLTLLGKELMDHPERVADAPLEQQLYALQAQKSVGKLLHGLQLSRHYLSQADDVLRQTADANRLCPMGKKSQRGEYLFNVFVKFYAGGIQPYLSVLHRQSGPLLEQLHALRRIETAAAPGTYGTFYDRWLNPETRDGLWRSFDAALKDHTRSWQTVLTHCGLMPQGPDDLR
ncbi:DUF3080 family protein [Methylolobus aquaticus]|nr:DUF3080 family protein [Methylolobus aquaticus]